jgi:hypothetical protein
MHQPQETQVKGPPNPQPPKTRSKTRGNLAATLDPQLRPRRSGGRIGRPKGARNYEWTPEIDRLLAELCAERAPAAKRTVGRAILRARGTTSVPTPDSLRKAVEHRMATLGIPTPAKRRIPEARVAKRWTEAQTAALLGALGADATIESIALRTCHTVKAVRAKIARLDYRLHEIHGFAVFTVAELSELLQVTQRQIRRWKERGWLETEGRRITEKCLGQFLRERADRVPFDELRREDQIYLLDLGYPRPEAVVFKKNVREILDGIGRQRKPRRPVHNVNGSDASDAGEDTASGSEAEMSG